MGGGVGVWLCVVCGCVGVCGGVEVFRFGVWLGVCLRGAPSCGIGAQDVSRSISESFEEESWYALLIDPSSRPALQVVKSSRIAAVLAKYQRPVLGVSGGGGGASGGTLSGGGLSGGMLDAPSAPRVVMGRAIESKPSPETRLLLSRGFHSDRSATPSFPLLPARLPSPFLLSVPASWF